MTYFSKNKEALLSLKKPKAIIFDWDNTLVDTWPLIQSSIDDTLVKMGKEPWGLQKVMDNVHKSMSEYFPVVFGSEWEKAGDIYRKSYADTHLDKLQFLPKALHLIDVIEEKGFLQAIISNKMGPTLRKEAEKLGVSKKFFTLVGAGDAIADKPSKHPVDLALKGSGLDPKKNEIWFIGDTLSDLECACNSGCQPIILGCPDGGISKTIPVERMSDGQDIVPFYFHHQDLIDVVSKF